MAFKRALWSSGYTYQVVCPACGMAFSYNDRQLDFRPWYPNGYIYCPRCRKPFRHSEIYAVHPDGTRVYNTVAEAEQAINNGYYNMLGVNQPPAQAYQPPVQPAQPSYQQPVPPVQMQQGESFCSKCGRAYRAGVDHFCSGCGNKLD